MRHTRAIILALSLCAGLQADAAGAETAGVAAAKTWPCYWTRGRLWIAQGGPSIRLWPVGTHRILGIVNPRTGVTDVDEAEALPPRVADVLVDHVDVWGTYHVCPIVPERRGWMRYVVIDRAAGKLYVHKSD